MALAQVLLNGLLLGGIYACIGAGFSIVWGVVNIINILHGSFIVLGAYGAFFAHQHLGLHPFMAMLPLAGLGYLLGQGLQRHLIRHVMAAKVLVTLTLTFGLNLLLNNLMIYAFSADFRKVVLPNQEPLVLAGLTLPMDRLLSMLAAAGVVLATHLLVTRTMLYDHLFDEYDESLSNLVDVYISNLRRKLGRELITTRRGQGYLIDD